METGPTIHHSPADLWPAPVELLMRTARDAYYRLPATVQGAIAVRRRAPAWLRAGLVFIHIPKAAGTSISNSLYGEFLGHVRGADVERWAPRRVKALQRLAVTRNPWDRVVSAFRYSRRLHSVDWRTNRQVPPVIRRQLPAFDHFHDFVTWLARQNVRRSNWIFQPQSLWVFDRAGKLLVDHVGRVEDLEPTFAFLRERLPAFTPIGNTNRSGDPVDYRKFYTAELAALVSEIYAEDVRNFGYEFDG